MFRKFLYSSIFLITFFAHAQQMPTYLVQRGDTLSTVIQRFNLSPIYGKKGYLEIILKKNPALIKSHGNIIIPGQTITLDNLLLGPAEQIGQAQETGPAPAALQEPELVPVAHVLKDKSTYSYLTVGLNKGFVSVDGKENNGTTGRLNSSSASGVNLFWTPKISELFWLDLGINYQQISFNKSSTRTLKFKNQNLTSLYINGNYQVSDKLRTEISIGQSDQILYRALNLSTIEIDKLAIVQSSAALRYEIYRAGNMSYAIKGGMRVHYPFKNDYYTGKLGHGFFGGLMIEHELERFTLLGQAFYSQDKFPVKQIDFTRHELGLGFGLRFKFGE